MSTARKHHLVSAGLQRNFGAGDFIQLVSKTTDFDSVVHVRTAFWEKDYNSLRTGAGVNVELESEWTRIEDWALPLVRSASATNHTPTIDLAIKALMMTHWTRSYAMREVGDRIFKYAMEEHRVGLDDDPKLLRAFENQFGRPPQPGEMVAHFDTNADDLKTSNRLDVQRMVRHYNKGMKYLDPLHVQLITPATRRIGLILSDNPVVTQKYLAMGVHHRVALLDATAFFMPLTRWLAMTLTTKPQPDVEVSPIGAQELNRGTWRNALRFIACHPDQDWRRACAFGPAYVPASRT